MKLKRKTNELRFFHNNTEITIVKLRTHLLIKTYEHPLKRVFQLYTNEHNKRYFMKHAYCIIAHNEPIILQKLIEAIDDDRNDIYS